MNKAQKQVLEAQLKAEQRTLKKLQKVYKTALDDIDKNIAALLARTDTENLQSIIYQVQYQKALKQQINGILDTMQAEQFTTISEYLTGAYENAYVGTMYDLHKQGIPIITPINQKQVVKALTNDSKLSKPLYETLGVSTTKLKNNIQRNLSAGIASGKSYAEIADAIGRDMLGNPQRASGGAYYLASRIARTEGHRVQNQAVLDAQHEAKDKGADIVKQWDATLDDRTRPDHAEADGQIREIDDDFIVGGVKMQAPGIGGSAEQVINCRCACLQRAKWALDEDELKTLEERANFFGLDKSKDFEDFKDKYLVASETTPEQEEYDKIIGEIRYKQYSEKYGFGDGTAFGIKKTVDANIYETKDGVKFVFPKNLNKSKQQMTPEKALELWGKVPEEIRQKAPPTIEFVDYYNPQDSYWKKVYKNFTHSYATGGSNGISFYRHDYAHDDDYVVRTFCHETGHVIDQNIKTGSGKRFCDDTEWTKAMADDLLFSGISSPTSYGQNANAEDLAESVAEFVANPKDFEKKFPNRTKVIKRITGIK